MGLPIPWYAVLESDVKAITVGWTGKRRFKIQDDTLIVDNLPPSAQNITEKPRGNSTAVAWTPWSTLLYGPGDEPKKTYMTIAGPWLISGADNDHCYTAVFGDDNYNADYQLFSIRKLWVDCDHIKKRQVRYSLPGHGATQLIVKKPNDKKSVGKVV